MEQKIKDVEQKLQDVLDSMPHGITGGIKHNLTMANTFAKEYWKKGGINHENIKSYSDYIKFIKKQNI